MGNLVVKRGSRVRRSIERRAVGALFAAAIAIGASASGCGSDSATTVPLDSTCSLNSDCDPGLVCAFERCHSQCSADRDCTAPSLCVKTEKPANVCQLPDEQTCTSNIQCAGDQVCAADGRCREGCTTDRDCVSGDTCAQGTCARPSEVDGGILADASIDASVGAPCVFQTDCLGGLVCKAGLCIVECKSGSDCASGECNAGVCAKMDAGKDASVIPDATTQCRYSTDCTYPLVCRSDATCGFQCMVSDDCGPNATCNPATHRCVGTTEIPDGSPDGYGASCVLSSDCPTVSDGMLVCKSAVCVYQCNEGIDCNAAQGECCKDHACVSGPACLSDGGTTDDGGLDGGPDAMPNCHSNDECDDKLYCDGIEICQGGFCIPGDSPCDSHAVCVKDSCDETTHACTHDTLAPSDQDGDGHYALACGGDDCDDTDGTVYEGAPELCDHKDNDCNGLVDDHSRHPLGAPILGTIKPNSNLNTLAAPVGTGFVAFIDNAQTTAPTDPACLESELLSSPSSTPSVLDDDPMFCGGGSHVFATAGETNTAAAIYRSYWQFADPLRIVIVKPDGSLVSQLDLLPPDSGIVDAADLIWTGSAYLAAFATSQGGDAEIHLQFVHTDGSLGAGTSIPSTVHSGTSNLFVARSASAFAVAWWDPVDNHVYMATLSSSLGMLAAPFTPTSVPEVLGGLAGTKNGFVIVWWSNATGTTAQWFASDGTPGATSSLSLGSPSMSGDFDGEGAAFAVSSNNLAYFVYANDMMTNPIEVTALPINGDVGTSAILSGRRIQGGEDTALFFGEQSAPVEGLVVGCSE